MWCQILEGDQFKRTVDTSESQKASMRCQDRVKTLENLGFEVIDGKKQGHKVFVHQAIKDFYSASFTCGHGRNPEILPAYITKIHK